MLLTLPLLLLFVSHLYRVCGDSIVDEEECKLRSVSCPRVDDPSYAKYCCASSDGYLTCCNPYISIGLGISIPLVIILLLVALIIIIVCILIKCRSPKYQPAVPSVAYAYRRVREEREGAAADAPPSYMFSQGPPPAYTEADVQIRDGLSEATPTPRPLVEARHDTQ